MAVEIPAGMALTAELFDDYERLTDAWQAFTCTWTATVSNPTLGNGTITAYYRLVGNTVDFAFTLLYGSTSSGGSGKWQFSVVPGYTPIRNTTVAAFTHDLSLSDRYGGSALVTPAVGVFSVVTGPGGGFGHNTTDPFTWATGDELTVAGKYEWS